ncbi:TetR family transcriptional regulator [Prauserella rugosa]|uniref:TetR family transcriptional regulator n=1 Tax=Prauserella rugosa TaxID=43354 RepID=A0A660CBK3_9PSEU|nr:TetR family transcriptional regulator [Prauserella rugosa]KMS65999.1 TetR family transcriptional regulator [Streptomyces regensis]TWH18899.1 TetR family transcriptional regulator [Prauserella rugosa]
MATRASGRSTREAIRAAASRLFRERGYARTPVRDIAALAEVNPALVIRYFGSKEELFLETMRLTIDDEPLLDVPIDRFGERFVDVVLSSEQDIRDVHLALVRGSGEERIAERLREVHEDSLVAPLRARLSGVDADLRARMAAAVVGGLLYSLWIVGDHALESERDVLVRRYGAIVQDIITPET